MPLSAAATAALLNRATDKVFVFLVTITHGGLTDVIRVTNNGADVVSNGSTFQTFPFTVEAPSDTEDAPAARLVIANVDYTVGAVLDQIVTPADVRIDIIEVSEPDTLQKSFTQFKLRNVRRSATQIEGDLVFKSVANEPFPRIRVTPDRFPNLFR